MKIKRLAIYCGALDGKDPDYHAAAVGVGSWMAEHQIELVYGGGQYGLMGAVAQGVLNNGGVVHSVLTQELFDRGIALDGVTDRVITPNMDRRKEKMMDMADGMIAFPGGLGTLEEISQAASWTTVGDNAKPVAFYNYRGYYDDLKNQLVKMNQAGFLEDVYLKNICFADRMDEICQFMSDYHAPQHRTYQQ